MVWGKKEEIVKINVFFIATILVYHLQGYVQINGEKKNCIKFCERGRDLCRYEVLLSVPTSSHCCTECQEREMDF